MELSKQNTELPSDNQETSNEEIETDQNEELKEGAEDSGEPVEGDQPEELEGDGEEAEDQKLGDTIDEDDLKGKKVKVKTSSGEEFEVPFEEYRASFFRHKDYKAKTEQVAQLRKSYESALEQNREKFQDLHVWVDGSLSGYDQQINQIASELQQYNIRDLTDAQEKEYNKKQRILQNLQAQKEQVKNTYLELKKRWDETIDQFEQRTLLEENRKLKEALPELSDPVKAQRLQDSIQDYLYDVLGEDAEDFKALDHRYILMLRDAVRYRNLKSKSKEPVKVNKPNRVIRSDRARVNNADETRRRKSAAVKRARELGGRRNTASMLEQILSN